MRPLYVLAATIILTSAAIPVFGSPVAPWDDPYQPLQTRFWEYDFNDGEFLPPTVTAEDGNWDPGSDPVFTYSGSGDFPSVFVDPYDPSLGLGVGIDTATQASTLNIRIDVPNEANPDNVKYFWFAFDYCGTGVIPPPVTVGTDNPGYTVSPIAGTDEAYHVEGYTIITPQPRDEWVNIQLSANQGEFVWIDNVQVGSQCIPEPASAALLLLLFPLMMVRRNICSNKKQGSGKLYMSINKLFSFLYHVD